MSELHNHAIEIQQELANLGVIPDDSSIESYKQITGSGSGCQIFELCIENHSTKFIQKIDTYNVAHKYEEYETNLKFEFTNLKALCEDGFSVPQPYFLKLLPNSRNLPYYIMEKIEGLPLAEVREMNPDLNDQLTEKLVKKLDEIHNLDPQLIQSVPIADILENPYSSIDNKMDIFKLYLDGYSEDLKELQPVFVWLRENRIHYPCDQLVVTHGDFHSYNILIQENQEFKVIDWGSASLRDFRMDVAYAVTLESYVDKDQTFKDRLKRASLIANMYEKISKRKIEGLDYFMVLTCTFNLIRLYSMINNPGMTGITEEVVKFYKSVYLYFVFLAYIIKEICNIELNQITEYFGEKD